MSGTANIARSLTTRLNRKKSVTDGVGNGGLGRGFSMRKPEKQAPRPEISLPIELLSATNPLAYNAPDLPQKTSEAGMAPIVKHLTAVSSSTSLRSEGSLPALSSAASTTFTFSGISTPTDEVAENQVHDLQNRLKSLPESEIPSSPQSQKSYSSSKLRSPLATETPAAPASPAPAVPKRAPSHTKKTHQALARQRSVSRVRSDSSAAAAAATAVATASDDGNRQSTGSSRRLSTSSSKEPIVARSSADMFSARLHTGSAAIDADHPFGAELAKLTEVAEEFSPRREKAEEFPRSRARSPDGSERSTSSSRPAMPTTPKSAVPLKMNLRKQKPIIEPTVWDEEQSYLNKHGLRTFSAEEYMAEIGSPYAGSFPGVVY